MIFISLTPQEVNFLKDNYIIEIHRKMKPPINIKIDDGFIEEKVANVVCLNIFHVNTLIKNKIVKTNQLNTDIIIDLIYEKKQFQASGYFKNEIQ